MIFSRSSCKTLNFARNMKRCSRNTQWFRAIIDARKNAGLTQKELSVRTGIAQGDISKLENGNANPSIRTLQRLAAAMGRP